MSKKLSALLVLSVIINTSMPLLNASEVKVNTLEASETLSEVSEVITIDSEASSEVATEESEASSEVETEESEASSEVETEESEASSEVETEESEASSKVETEESDASSEAAAEESEEVLEDDFNIFTTLEYNTEVTSLGQKIDGGFSLDPAVGSSLKEGATIEITDADAFAFSNLKLTTEDGDVTLVEGTDYSVTGTKVTLLHDFEENQDIDFTYSVSIESGSTDVLGALSDSMYMDLNDNDKFDGTDYYTSNVGYMLEVTNGSASDSKDIFFDTEIAGGEVAITADSASMKKVNDEEFKATAKFTVENTGDYAMRLTSMSALGFLGVTGSDLDEYGYPELAALTSENFEFTVNGITGTTSNDLYNGATQTSDLYLNVGDTMEIVATYVNTSSDGDTIYDYDYYFDTYAQLKDASEAWIKLYLGNNVFGGEPAVEYVTQSIEIPVTKVVEDETDEADETATTEESTDETTTTEDEYSEMTVVGGESLAETGSTMVITMMALVTCLGLAIAAKFKMITK